MKATVIEIISGTQYTDGKRRVKLSFDVGEGMFKELKITEEALGQEVKLDDVVELGILHISQAVRLKPLNETPIDEVAHG